MSNREQLEYALKVQRLHDVLVLKDDIHLQYKYKNINRATTQTASFQDKIIDNIIENTVTGTDDLIDNSSIKNNVRKIIDTNLKNDAKRISYGVPEKVTKAAVSNISNRYQTILNNRINKEIPTLQDKIEQHIKENNLSNLSEAELTNKLKAEYGEHAQKRIQNIIRDSFHTNECNLSWVKAVYDGYSYKIWNNGRTKRTRVWHKAKFIQSVPIDETFDIYGSYPARMMYPGDLNGGAENVANCKCWLSYTNNKPSDLRGTGKKTTTKKSTKSTKSNKSKNNNGLISKVKNTVKKPVSTAKSKIKNISSKISSKIKPQKQRLLNEIIRVETDLELFNSPFYNPNDKPWRQIKRRKDLPYYLPNNIKDCIIDFEKNYLNFSDGNEYGMSYDYIYCEKSILLSLGLETRVSLPVKGNHKNSEILASHCHTDGSPPSMKDIINCLKDNDLYYVVIHGKNDLFIISVKNKSSSNINCLKREIKRCYKEGYSEALLNNKEPYDLIKRNLINNEILNNYMDMSVVIK